MTKNLFKQTNDRTIRHQILKQVQDDVKVGFGRTLAFTLAEVLIVIGIIGVVAALTLPNLNHATGDKETVTRLQKAYSILNEANDRAVAIYGPISTWSEECRSNLDICWMQRVGEFLKISKSCNEDQDISCDTMYKGDMQYNTIIYQLPDGITIGTANDDSDSCSGMNMDHNADFCFSFFVDINGPNKGKNKEALDIFKLAVSDSLGVTYFKPINYLGGVFQNCARGLGANPNAEECTWWVIENGNLDYLKVDEYADDGLKCSGSNIIIGDTTNTSCH